MSIQVLPSEIAERIAAGEVIERPSSVVKELVENSLDAGATEIAIVLRDGGKGVIEVLDNGRGMSRRDLELCTQRHATSKLRHLSDLEAIRTLGFRGEALASISAVTDLSVISRAQGNDSTFEVRVEPSRGLDLKKITFGHFLSAPHGTRIRAESLFSQIPARLKFLKSARAEVAAVREWIERLALTRPDVGFRLSSNDKIILNLRPSNEETRVQKILSDGQDYPIQFHREEKESPELKIRIQWVNGLSAPTTKRMVQVVNGRILRDRLVQQAILQPFRQTLLPGQFPAIAVFIDIDPAFIDVNVHPTKTEVRFLESGQVFRAIQSAVERMISKEGYTGFVASSLPDPHSASQLGSQSISMAKPLSFGEKSVPPQRSLAMNLAHRIPETEKTETGSEILPTKWTASEPTMPSESHTHVPPQTEESTQFHPSRYVGSLFRTYLIYDLGEEVGLVDQHAAHERVRYEKLKKSILEEARTPPRQDLLLPEVVDFPAEQKKCIEERMELFKKFGFEVEFFGESSLVFRSIPSVWGTSSLPIRLKNLVDRVLTLDERKQDSSSNSVSGVNSINGIIDEKLFESLASEACHSAIRAGDALEDRKATELTQQLFRCEHPWNCPHGRPTLVRIPKARFEEWFQRRV